MKLAANQWKITEAQYGPFWPYIQDPEITDLNFDGQSLWVEHLQKGIYKTEDVLDPEFVQNFCVRISNLVNFQLNQYDNVLEAESDILRISVIHPSVTSRDGYVVSIRKSPARCRLTEEKMRREGYCTEEILNFLKNCIRGRMNLVFCGQPGAGKTELLKYLTEYIPKEEKTMTIEDNLEIHYRELNSGANCVELKVEEGRFSYTKAIKTALRQNPQWVLLSEARSVEVKYLLECFSAGLNGMTTLHTDDVRKIPDRIQNMMQDYQAATRLENDIYSFINVGVLLRKKMMPSGRIRRYVDQICIFDRIGGKNVRQLLVEDGKILTREVKGNVKKKFLREGVEDPFG